MIETYDDLEWDIDEMPIGSSTPDEFFELSYRATANCPHCGEEIQGTAQMWSRDEFSWWLDHVDYEPCNCQDEDEEEDDWDEDEDDDLDISEPLNNKP